LDLSASGITTSKYQQVRNRLQSIEINLSKMCMADRPGQQTEEGDTSNTMQEKVLAQDNSSPDESEAR
jgi:hypothetical protein